MTDPRSAPEHARSDYYRRRDTMIRSLRGTVLDLGAGTGAGLARIDPEVSWVGLEPDAARRRKLAAVAARQHGETRVIASSAEDIPLPSGSVDAVVSTHVLCSVSDQEQALREVRRVLAPDGHLVLAEHVGAPRGSRLRRVQQALAPATRMLDHGCDPSRDTEDALRASGFELTVLDRLWLPVVPGVRMPFILAEARPRAARG